MFSLNPLKIVHLPTTTAGNPHGLSQAERLLGLDSTTIAFLQNYYIYQADRFLFSKGRHITNEFKRWMFILRDLKTYDVVHYNYGMTAAPQRINETGQTRADSLLRRLYNLCYARHFEGYDLRSMRRLGKVVAVTFMGDDARQGGHCRSAYPIHFVHEVEPGYYSDLTDRLKQDRIAMFQEHADLIYAMNPDLLSQLSSKARFLPYTSVDPRQWQPRTSQGTAACPHLVHAPSHRLVKGTRFVEEAVSRLRAEGLDFRYTQVEGLANAEARKIYETADLLVDQLLAGWYGGLAVELMALGKPVISYIRESDLRHVPVQMRKDLPIITATPATIYEVLKTWLTAGGGELHKRGQICRKFVETWHDPLRIAAKVKADYEAVLAEKRARAHHEGNI